MALAIGMIASQCAAHACKFCFDRTLRRQYLPLFRVRLGPWGNLNLILKGASEMMAPPNLAAAAMAAAAAEAQPRHGRAVATAVATLLCGRPAAAWKK